MTSQLSTLPSVDKILKDRRVSQLVESFSRELVTELVREHIANARQRILKGQQHPSFDHVVNDIVRDSLVRWSRWPQPVINATGVILHTNLGRAPLSNDAIKAVQSIAGTGSNLELDLETGKRGSRNTHVSELLRQLTGAEMAIAVNNNAAAITLGLAVVAPGKQVLISRGQAVEIGGGFRIPEVLKQSGAELVEVGTTNRTYIQDYENSINENTGAILTVHASNFKVVGFVHSPTLDDLVALGHKYNLPVLHDLGSGCFMDTAEFGLPKEPRPQDSIAAGVDMVFFSGDKLLGGPQAGIIAGSASLMNPTSKHPLVRALRMDKLTLTALVTTLLHYIRNEATTKIPVWRMISISVEELDRRVQTWQKMIGDAASVTEGQSVIGGGSLPEETLRSKMLSIDPSKTQCNVEELALRLRKSTPSILGRIVNQSLMLDARTVLPEEDDALISVVKSCL